jgi:hypothetical protein
MGRSIITTAPKATVSARSAPGREPQEEPAVDGYSEALLKLIPAEVIGVYLAMQSILVNSEPKPGWEAILVVFMFGMFATYFYLRVSLKVTNNLQLALSVGAFCVWAYSMLPQDFNSMLPPGYSIYNGTYAGLLLIAYTFIAPKIPLDIKKKSS